MLSTLLNPMTAKAHRDNAGIGHEILVALCVLGKGGEYCVVAEKSCFIFLLQKEGGLWTPCLQTDHFTLYSMNL